MKKIYYIDDEKSIKPINSLDELTEDTVVHVRNVPSVSDLPEKATLDLGSVSRAEFLDIIRSLMTSHLDFAATKIVASYTGWSMLDSREFAREHKEDSSYSISVKENGKWVDYPEKSFIAQTALDLLALDTVQGICIDDITVTKEDYHHASVWIADRRVLNSSKIDIACAFVQDKLFS